MKKQSISKVEELLRENDELRSRLKESEEALNAIRNKEAEAIIVCGSDSDKVYSLNSSETPYRTIFDHMAEGAAIITSEGTIRYFNQRFAEILSPSGELAVGSNIIKLISGDQESKLRYLLEIGLKRNVSGIISIPNNLASGQSYVNLSLNALPSEAAGDLCIIVSDVTKLQEDERRLRRFYESGMLGVIYWNLKGEITDANDKFLEMVGYSRDELRKGMIDWVKMTPTEYKDLDENSMFELKTLGVNKAPFEKEYLRKDGTRIPIIISGAMLDNERTNGVAFVLEITIQKKAIENLFKNEKRLASVYDTVGDTVFLLSIEGDDRYRFISVNRAFCCVTGLKEEMIVGKLVSEVIPEPSLTLVLGKYKQAITEKSIIRWEEISTYPAGTLVGEGSIAPVIDEEGSCTSLVGSVHNITERKQAEVQLRILNRIYSLLSSINQAIVRTRDPKVLFENVCNIAIEKGGFGMAWIGLIDESTQKLQVVAQAGRASGYLELVDISVNGKPVNYCPIDSVLRQGKHIVCKIIKNKQMASCQKNAYELGFRSSASFPLKVSDILKGALTFYSDLPEFFDESELKLLDELAMDISFAMEYAEKEDKRKMAEEELLKAEELFRTTLDHMMEGCQLIGFDLKYLYINEVAASQGRLIREKMLDRTMMELYHGIEKTQMFANILKCMEKHVPSRMENEFLYPDGTKGWFALSFEPVPEGVFILSTDITARKQAEQKLQEREARYKTLIENIPQKIFLKSKDYRWVSVNKNFARDLGISPEEAEGKMDFDLFPKELADKYHSDDVRIIETGKAEELEEKYVENGKESWVNTIKTPVRDGNGEIVGLLGIFWDITEQKLAKEEIQKLNNELEDRVVFRTAQLEAANKELESFSYSVSHDLRAPLRSIHSYTNILLEEYENILDDEGKRLCSIISSSAKKMGNLIDDLLSFSRIGRTSVNPSLLNMSAMAASVFSEITTDQEKARINIKVGKLHQAHGDPTLMRLVWMNLISNAIKYSSKEIVSEITIHSKKDGEFVTYIVEDNGVGFDMQYKSKLFGVFQRLHSESEFEGNGVGLAIIQRIITKHNGKVWAEAEVGKGAIFYFSLPAGLSKIVDNEKDPLLIDFNFQKKSNYHK